MGQRTDTGPEDSSRSTTEVPVPTISATGNSRSSTAAHRPQVSTASTVPTKPRAATATSATGRSSHGPPATASSTAAPRTGSGARSPASQAASSVAGSCRPGRMGYGSTNDGSVGSVTAVSRSQPSFSSLMVWIATALAFASSSGSASNSETQQR